MTDEEDATLSAKVSELRDKFFDQYSDCVADGTYHEDDLERLRRDDRYLRCYLLHQKKDVEKASNMINTSFKFRKELGLNDLTESSFDRDAHELGAVYYHNHDKEGHKILILHSAKHKKDPQKTEQAKKFVAWWIDKSWLQDPTERIVLLFDMTNAGISNMDMDIVKFDIACFSTYYPALLAYMLIFDMPWVMNAIWKIIKQLLSAEQQKYVMFVKKADMTKYIAADQLMVHMGGTDNFEYKHMPFDDSGFVVIPNGKPAGIPTDSKKKVTFAEKENILYASYDGDSVEDDAGNASKAALNAPPKKPGKERSKDNDMFVGAFAAISPSDHLEFKVADKVKETLEVLTIANISDQQVAFKVKTTSPDSYRVRPSSGLIKPQCAAEVNVFLQPGGHSSVQKDKFLAMVTKVGDSVTSSGQVTEMWKKLPRDPEVYFEHRLWCQVDASAVTPPPSPTDPTPKSDSEILGQQLTTMTKQMRDMLASQDRLERRVRHLLVTTVMLTVLLLVLLIGLVINHLREPESWYSTNNCTASSCLPFSLS